MKEIGPLNHHRADQKTAVGAPIYAESARASHAARDEILGNRYEIVEGTLAVLLERRGVPVGTVFATSTYVRHDPGAAVLQPSLGIRADIGRRHRGLEATIAQQHSR